MKRPNTRHRASISRRDILHGLAIAGAGAMLPGRALADAVEALERGAYPPAKMGMRGNHPGSWEVAHQLAREGQRSWGNTLNTQETYDLVVVGAGISGLSAAYFYRQQHPGARILILDNHDDFGGHAKRNEFSAGGRSVLGYGGSQSMESPGGYSKTVRQLLRDLAIDLPVFEQAFEHDFYTSHQLQGGVFFSEQHWGQSRMVKFDIGGLGDYLPLAENTLSPQAAAAAMPLSDAARQQLLQVLTETRDCMPDIPAEEKEDYLYTLSYRDFLQRHLQVTEPEVFRVLEDLAADTGLGIDAAPARDAIFYSALPGRAATGIAADESVDDPYIHHFPDGNASVARLLVRRLIPACATGQDMFDIVTTRFDYSKLDHPSSRVRLRLNSTVVNVHHLGSPKRAKEVSVTYIQDGKAVNVRASGVILACYHSIIPSLCPELPQQQRDAMALQVKVPILYTNVALHNWRAWKEMGIGGFVAPGEYHINAMLDFPVSIGAYRFAAGPDDPIVVHMERFPHGTEKGLSTRDRLRAGRRELLMTPFSDIEASVRDQLGEALSPGDFKAERDIAGITVNRWAHGYSFDYGGLDDYSFDDWDDPRYPHMQARKPFGRIAMANADADANAMMEAAIEQAYRAVEELG